MRAETHTDWIALVDYGIGNLRSVEKALTAVGAEVRLTSDINVIRDAKKVVLPGVGAFGDGMRGLEQRGLVEVMKTVVQRGTPFLGICVGMQLLFDGSEENPEQPGLGLLPGWVRRFPENSLKVPQTGWNQIVPVRETPLLRDLLPGSYAYFNHGYYCDPIEQKDWLARTDYGFEYVSVIGRDSLYGMQFHPEKSQQIGLLMLRNFVELC